MHCYYDFFFVILNLFQQQTALGETGVVGKNNYDVIITNSSIHEQQEISLFNKHTKPSLLQIFNTTSFEHVKWNNWDMGCNDLAISAPYYRAISDRLYKHDQIRKKFLIFDIGANTGQDAANIFGTFHEIEGMCKSYNIPYHLISVEPSPKVFCELNDTAKKKRWPGSHPYHFLNIALSDSTGILKFADPGNEGGSLVLESSTVDKLGEMNETEFKKAQKCSLQTTTDKKQDDFAMVPTYTMDLLVSSLQNFEIASPTDNVFILKIDTEGHDAQVIKGSSSLLDQKRITFVLFEVWTNRKIKEVAEFMASKDYLCFLFTPKQLVPVDGKDWWYENLNEDKDEKWWGNGVCGIRGSESMAMFWRMYHSDNLDMVQAFELL